MEAIGFPNSQPPRANETWPSSRCKRAQDRAPTPSCSPTRDRLLQKLTTEAERKRRPEVRRHRTWRLERRLQEQAFAEILKSPASYDRINSVLCIDGIHTGYVNGKTRTQENRPSRPTILRKLDQTHCRDAIAGKKRMIITHSEIFPGTLRQHHRNRRLPQRKNGVWKPSLHGKSGDP